MSEYVEDLVASYGQGRHDETRRVLEKVHASSSLSFVSLLASVYHEFDTRQDAGAGANFIMFAASQFAIPANLFLILVQKLGETSPEWLRANLFLMYINNGGNAVEVFDKTIYYLCTHGEVDAVVHVYRLAVAAGVQDQLVEMTLFNVATTMIGKGLFQESFDIYVSMLPRAVDPYAIWQNIFALARTHKLPDAIPFVARYTNDMLDGYSTRRSAAPDSVELDYRGPEEEAALVSAVLSKGFCVVRGGCKLEVVERLFHHVSTEMNDGFPAEFDGETAALAPELFRFDSKRVLRDILKYSSELDLERSIIRRVRAGTPHTFTPFHQDVTAFLKAVVNIWVPLTPAGGEYPTIDLIQKRISRTEQTKLTDGEYSLVEIEESHVMEKYGDLFYTLESASPGDCVIFLGSTIHRSSNLDRATKDRFNLEVRFS